MRRLLTPGWIAVHIGMAILVVAFLSLGAWQWQRAGEGSARSFAYSLEWPIFALFVVFVWIKEIRDTLRPPLDDSGEADAAADAADRAEDKREWSAFGSQPDPRREQSESPPVTDQPWIPRRPVQPSTMCCEQDDDPQLAAYNQYLARINAQEQR